MRTRLRLEQRVETETELEDWQQTFRRERELEAHGFDDGDEFVPLWMGDMEEPIQPNKTGVLNAEGRLYAYEPRRKLAPIAVDQAPAELAAQVEPDEQFTTLPEDET